MADNRKIFLRIPCRDCNHIATIFEFPGTEKIPEPSWYLYCENCTSHSMRHLILKNLFSSDYLCLPREHPDIIVWDEVAA